MVMSILALDIFAIGELSVELGNPQLLPREGFEQEVFIPFVIKNIGNQPITSRFPLKRLGMEPEAVGYPLYIYTGDVKGPEYIPNPVGVPIKDATGKIYYQKPEPNEVVTQEDGSVVVAPTITLQPGESLPFEEQKLMNSFYVAKSGKYTFGYEVDPENELPTILKNKAKATVTLQVGNPNVIKGPNKELKLNANQYWFYYNDIPECVEMAIPKIQEVCLLAGTPFVFKMSIGVKEKKEISLYHFFDWWSTTKEVDGISITATEDGFVLTY